MKFKRLAAAVLAALLLASFAACSASETASAATSAAADTAAETTAAPASTETGREDVKDDLPQLDYSGAAVGIYTRDTEPYSYEMGTETENGEGPQRRPVQAQSVGRGTP
jgi:ABC-type glycerol-3-phosphate transport system substrate-binding protein